MFQEYRVVCEVCQAVLVHLGQLFQTVRHQPLGKESGHLGACLAMLPCLTATFRMFEFIRWF